MPNLAHVEIYTWSTCPYCNRAKALLRELGVNFQENVIDGDEAARAAMAERANGRRSVPQIFINGNHLGGCDDLYASHAEGRLTNLLGVAT